MRSLTQTSNLPGLQNPGTERKKFMNQFILEYSGPKELICRYFIYGIGIGLNQDNS